MSAQGYNGGFFNHYDDPDEDWDEAPLVPTPPPIRTRSTPAVPPSPVPPSPNPAAAPPEPGTSGPEHSRSGSQFISMEVDRGFLPARIDFSPSWAYHIAPHEIGDELMRAYRKDASDRMQRTYFSGRWPTPQEVFESAVPDRRTIMMVLLETATWAEYSSLQRKMIRDVVLDAFGKVTVNGEHPVAMSADRRYVLSIRVASWWVHSASPAQIIDEVIWCAQQIRMDRPRFVPKRDYSRFSDMDLEFHLKRHREQLIEEGIRSRV